MGVNTRGIMNKKVKLADIVKVLEDKFGVATSIRETHDKDYRVVLFAYNGTNYSLSVFTNYDDLSHVEEYFFIDSTVKTVTLIDMSLWEESVEIVEGIVEEFGGYMVNMDTRDKWRMVDKVKNSVVSVTGKTYLVHMTLEGGECVSMSAQSNDNITAMNIALNRLEKNQRENVMEIKMEVSSGIFN